MISDGGNEGTVPMFPGEKELDNLANADSHPARIIIRSDGYYILREWDAKHGWGDRGFRSLGDARNARDATGRFARNA